MSSAAVCTGVASPRMTTSNAAAAASAVKRGPATAGGWRGGAERPGSRAVAVGASCVRAREVPKSVFVEAGFCQSRQAVAWLARGVSSPLDFGPMSRTFLATLHFDGTGFVGWQRQPAGRSVQAEFERVLERLFGHPAPATAAGRTDAGVHADGLAVSFPAPDTWTPSRTSPRPQRARSRATAGSRESSACEPDSTPARARSPAATAMTSVRMRPSRVAVSAPVRMGARAAARPRRAPGGRHAAARRARLPRVRREGTAQAALPLPPRRSPSGRSGRRAAA